MSTPDSPAAVPARQGPFRRLGGWIASRPAAIWARIGPSPRTRRAVSFGALLVALAFGAFVGTRMESGLGVWADMGIGAGILLVLSLLIPLAMKLLAAVFRWVPRNLGWFGTGALVALAWALDRGLPENLAYLGALVLVACAALVFGSVAVITAEGFKRAGTFKKAFAVLSLVIGLGGAGTLTWWTMQRGDTEHLVATPVLAAEHQPAALDLEDPSTPGGFPVRTLTYGSGTDRHRPEFGEQVSIRTEPVNGKPFAQMPSGMWGFWKNNRKAYWGFGLHELPRNGRVWYPEGEGPFPLVLMVHGNHHMADFSDPGYAYLGELFASRGIIAVSVDENFLNGSMVAGGLRKENDCRAWMLLEHLQLWRRWSSEAGHAFEGKVDLSNIGLVGHSRGGEAVALAAVFNRLSRYPDDASVAFDYGFDIRGVISIAPVDGQYKPADKYAAMRDVSYFTIHGGHDADVSSFHGDRIYRRLEFSGPGPWFKSSLYVYRANHGQWNTVWGDTDTGPPAAWLLNRAALMPAAEQRKIAEVYFAAFFAATLQGQHDYVALFRDHLSGRDWLPDTLVVSRYEDPTYRNVCDFEEDVDVTTATLAGSRIDSEGLVVWREGDIPLRGGSTRYDNGVFVGWNSEADAEETEVAEVNVAEATGGAEPEPRPAAYAIHLPEGFATTAEEFLVFNLGESKEEAEAEDYTAEEESQQPSDEQQEQGGGSQDEESGGGGEEEGEEEEEDADRPPLDLTVQLVDQDGVTVALPLSRFGVIVPPLKVRITRTEMMEGRYRSAYEPVLQTFRLPLSAFAEADSAFATDRIATIRWVFDRAPEGVVILDRIGFAAN